LPESAPGRRKIVFVAEQFAPPVVDGSTYVYKNWIDFLAERYELYAIFFITYSGDPSSAERYLRERCRAHLILPGAPRRRLWKVARAAVRFATGTLLAPRWLEELGRSEIHRTIAGFVSRHALDLFLVSKLVSVPLFGESNIRDTKATFLLDLHDDFVSRDQMERQVLGQLLSTHPEMASYPNFRNLRLRQGLSRLVPRRARTQESRICRLFDAVLASSLDEFRFYRTVSHLGSRCEHLGWPPPLVPGGADHAAPLGAPGFDAGFIGGDHPFNVQALIYFLNEILPHIRRHRPGFRFLVAGKVSAPVALTSAAWPGVEFRGYVPDVRSFYEQVAVSAVPILSGTGVSLKTLEALDFGRPVVATRMGVRGLSGIDGHPDLLLAGDAADFAAKVLLALGRSATDREASRSPLKTQNLGPSPEEFQVRFERLLRAYSPREERVEETRASRAAVEAVRS
jgi:glycosyltransferase involved in cell wall biosynthesis